MMDDRLLQRAVDALRAGKPAVMATVVATSGSAPRREGSKLLYLADGTSVGSVGGGVVESRVLDRCKDVIASGAPETVDVDITGKPGSDAHCGGTVTVFLDPLGPHWHLVVAGGGHVGKAVASLARETGGFSVTVVEDREDILEGIPEGIQRVVGSIPECLGQMDLTDRHAVVIVTRAHEMDEESLAAVVGRGAAYVGMMGSRRKVKTLFEDLKDRGVDETILKEVYSPIGLNVGAETPAEIAISILAEILTVLRNSSPGHCREKK